MDSNSALTARVIQHTTSWRELDLYAQGFSCYRLLAGYYANTREQRFDALFFT
jgi:hypothetical protein